MNVKKIAAGATMAAALGFCALGGAGFVQAKPHVPGPCDVVAGNCWLPGDPPGHNPIGPPGQICTETQLFQDSPGSRPVTGATRGSMGYPRRGFRTLRAF